MFRIMENQIDVKAIAVIEKRVAPLITQATKIKITTQEEQNAAGELLTAINKEADAFKALKETITKPMNAALKAAREIFKPRETKLEEAIQTLRDAMGSYQLAADKKAEADALKLANRVEKGTMKAETAVRKMDEIDTPTKEIETVGGSVKFRTDKKLKITDSIALVKFIVKNGMYQMLDIDEAAVLLAIKQGNVMPGAEIEEVKTVINSR